MKQILEYKNIVIPLQRNRERLTTSRSGAVVARWAHNPKVVSSSLASATKLKLSVFWKLFFFYSPQLSSFSSCYYYNNIIKQNGLYRLLQYIKHR